MIQTSTTFTIYQLQLEVKSRVMWQHSSHIIVRRRAKMSYQSGWGYESVDQDSLSISKIESAENSHLKEHTLSTNTFVLQCRVSKDLREQCNESHVYKFQIHNDYEQSSPLQIARYLRNQMLNTTMVIPSLLSPTFTVITRHPNDVQLIAKLCKQLDYSVSGCKAEATNDDTDYLRQHVLESVLHHLMKRCGYFAFSIEDQVNGVVAKRSDKLSQTDECQSLDVVAVRNCVLNDRNEVFLTVECFHYRMFPFKSSDETAVFMPSLETVTVKQVIPTSTKLNNINAFLTAYDQQCRIRGYNQYLPDRADSFSLHWELLYGLRWREGDSIAHVKGVREAAAGGAGWMTVGDRVVPVQALCRAAGEVPSKTKQRATDIAQRFITSLSTVPYLSEVKNHTRETSTMSWTNKGFKVPFKKPSQSVAKKMVHQPDLALSIDDDLLFGESEMPTVPRKKARRGK